MELQDEWSTAWGRCAPGLALKSLGSFEEPLEHYTGAQLVFHEFDDKLNKSRALSGIGEAHGAMRCVAESGTHVDRAKMILSGLSGSETANLWARIHELDHYGS